MTEFLTNLILTLVRILGETYFMTFRIVFIILDIILLKGVIILWRKVKAFRPSFFLSKSHHWRLSLDVEELEARWKVIRQKVSPASPRSYVLAIIEADTFVDTLLKRLGFQGEHMADRLEELEDEDLETLDRLKRAHRIRNHLVHTPDFILSSDDAEDVLLVYEKFLEEIGALPSRT